MKLNVNVKPVEAKPFYSQREDKTATQYDLAIWHSYNLFS